MPARAPRWSCVLRPCAVVACAALLGGCRFVPLGWWDIPSLRLGLDGGDTVELELATLQGRNALAGESASTRTSVMLPLGEWMTVAESEQTRDGQHSGLVSRSRDASQSRLQVQVRVNLR